ncbi:hypothetical protein ACKFKF_25815 [Phormidesmis sp. 146-12]
MSDLQSAAIGLVRNFVKISPKLKTADRLLKRGDTIERAAEDVDLPIAAVRQIAGHLKLHFANLDIGQARIH